MRGMKFNFSSVALVLIIINVVVYTLQIAFGDPFTSLFVVLKGDLINRPWTLITSMFLHGSPTHIFMNMWVLFMFGPLIEQRIGQARFLILYFVSGFFASLASSLVYDAALGASGAIMGVLGMVIILMPNLRVLFFFFIPMSMRTAGIIIAVSDIIGFWPGVAHAAHLAGLACGLLYGIQLKKKNKKYHKKFSSKTYMNSDDVDEYLRRGRI